MTKGGLFQRDSFVTYSACAGEDSFNTAVKKDKDILPT